MLFRQILCVLGEVVGLGECEGRANSTSEGSEVGRGAVLLKCKDESGEQRLGRRSWGPQGKHTMEFGHDAVSWNFPKSVL